jgi:uncharacterized protein with HEPN domain
MHEVVFMREYRFFLTDIVEAIDEIEDFSNISYTCLDGTIQIK